MRTGDKVGVVGITLIVGLFGVSAYGWVNNIILFAGSSFDPLTAKVIARGIGIFVVPLGVVMGYIR